jgi:hypothetical protein
MSLLLASALVTGCAGSSPLAPDSASVSNIGTNAAAPSASAPRTFLPPISPAGISCPSDAPQVIVGSLGLRMDIEFSEVTGAYAYEIEIMANDGALTRLEVPATYQRTEWYGSIGLYRIKVRTMNCGGLGNWSEAVYHTLDNTYVPPPPSKEPDSPVPPVEPPPVPPVEPPVDPPMEPNCMIGCF